MSIRLSIAAATTVMCLGLASPAYAWFGDGWLEKLSGPGPFHAWTADVRLICLSKPTATPEIARDPSQFRWKVTKELGSGKWLSPLGCHFLDSDQGRLEFGVQFMKTWSNGQNNLDYTHRPELADVDKAVGMRAWTITADARVNRVLDVGVAAGPATLTSADDEVFSDFSKWVFQPVRVTVRPFSVVSDTKRLSEFLSVRVDATMFNGGFKDEEFGARPGTFDETGELVWGWRVLFDLSTLFWLR